MGARERFGVREPCIIATGANQKACPEQRALMPSLVQGGSALQPSPQHPPGSGREQEEKDNTDGKMIGQPEERQTGNDQNERTNLLTG
ncbi:unnamed protein product [Lota lota]